MSTTLALLLEIENGLRQTYEAQGRKISFGLGAKHLDNQELAPPRIVWIPTTTKHSAASKERTNPKAILTREVSIVAHCWAVDASANRTPESNFDACEVLVKNLLVQLHKSAWGSIEMSGEEWVAPHHGDHGHAVLVTFVAKSPVQRTTYQTVQLVDVVAETANVAAGDSNVDWGEP